VVKTLSLKLKLIFKNEKEIEKMKKTISGVLLALAATCALVACGKKKTEKDETTTKKPRKRSGKDNIVSAYGWNAEFQTRVNTFYGGRVCINPKQKDGTDTPDDKKEYQGDKVEKVNGSATVLKSGVTIQWTTATNQGSIYQDTLDIALDNNIVDMFCFEADYATKYVKSEFVADLTALGVDQSDQFKYTKDIATNAAGKLVGSSWQACPGATIYNMEVAKVVWGDSVEYSAVEAKITDGYTKFKAAAAEVAAKTYTEGTATKHYNMIVGPASIYRLYAQNLSAKMYDEATNVITIDKALFEYANNSKEMAGYMAGTTDAYGQWGDNWAKEMSADSKTLCIFGCPWFVDFSFKDYRKATGTDSGWRVCKPYKSFFWGGTWVAATNVCTQAETVKNTVVDIIKDITTKKEIMLDITAQTKDFTNTTTGMNSIKDTPDAYFGGSKTIQTYLDSVATADMSKSSDFDQQIAEGFQAAFRTYIGEGASGKTCWDAFVSNLLDKTSAKEVKAAAGVTIDTNITIA